jgi:hypothetical protein
MDEGIGAQQTARPDRWKALEESRTAAGLKPHARERVNVTAMRCLKSFRPARFSRN